MIKFLNTELLNEAILEIFATAEKEIFIVVPFIKTSNYIQTALESIDKKGIELTIICRANELELPAQSFLNSLENLNLFSHPNVHSKCYFNERKLIITSLNMTAHSEQNNREMGVFIEKNYESQFDDSFWEEAPEDGYVNEKFYDDLKTEIQKILNASQFVKKSKRTLAKGFSSRLLRTSMDEIKETENMLNQFFNPKKFRYYSEWEHYDTYICEDFFDKFDLIIKDLNDRLELAPNKGEEAIWNQKLKHLHRKQDFCTLNNEDVYFTLYLNKGAKLNIVGNYEDFIDLSNIEKLKKWESILNLVSTYFTKELMRIR